MKKNLGFGIVGIIIIIMAILLLGIVAWRVFERNRPAQPQKSEAPSTTENANSNSSAKKVFKIPELGVEFEIKDRVSPLYSVAHKDWGGTPYTSITFSTQQVADKDPDCSFSQDSESRNFALLSVFVYDSTNDLAKIEPGITSNNIAPADGYVVINGRIYHIPKGIQEGQGICTDGDLESQQRTSLRSSLMTLKAID